MATRISFEAIATSLLNRAPGVLAEWFPNGRKRGHEWCVGNLQGEAGQSLKININTGRWADFSTGEKGGDLVSLYAAMHNIKQGEAAKRLSNGHAPAITGPARPLPQKPAAPLLVPPAETKPPDFRHRRYGEPVATWAYHNAEGQIVGYVARYEPDDGKKQFVPYSWSSEKGGVWQMKAWPDPRPLYFLQCSNSTTRVLVVEGEKAADAAYRLLGHLYHVVTWHGGAQAALKSDWSRLALQRCLLWPDRDQPGIDAMSALAMHLRRNVGVEEVKIIQPGDDDDGFDAADAEAEGSTTAEVIAWAKERCVVFTLPAGGVDGSPPEDDDDNQNDNQHPDDPGPDDDGSTSVSQIALWEEFGLSRAGNGNPIANVRNALAVISQWRQTQNRIWYDDFRQRIFTTLGHIEAREWSNTDTIELTQAIQGSIGISRVTEGMVSSAVIAYARRNARNELVEWFDSLKWDQTHRLMDVCPRGFGTDNDEYHQAVGEGFFIAMVARALKPGCKMDHMPVFEGSQGLGKSSALSIIGGEYYVECHETITNKDFYGVMEGNLVIEIAEMDAFSKAEVTRIKGVITCQVDRYRSPYERYVESRARRCVFAGTTNKDDWNRDETGARRFWPVRCGRIDLDWLRDNRAQLFAEAVAAYKTGRIWWDVPYERATEEQRARRSEDPWDEAILSWISNKKSVRMSEILGDCLSIEIGKQDKRTEMRAAAILRAHGWSREVRRFGGLPARYWIPPVTTPEPPDADDHDIEPEAGGLI